MSMNLGGGRENSISILESFAKVEALTGRPMRWSYVDENRRGDHICYISNLDRLTHDYPDWTITRSLDDIVAELEAAGLGKYLSRPVPAPSEDEDGWQRYDYTLSEGKGKVLRMIGRQARPRKGCTCSCAGSSPRRQ